MSRFKESCRAALAGGSLAGKVFVVTGGRSGIGQAVVDGLVRHGAAVESMDVSPAGEARDGVTEVVCDVSSSAAVAAAFADAVERHGGLDGLVQSAGITRDGLL